MRDLSAFPDNAFDLIVNPVSNLFCPDLQPVWQECYRVLRPGGALLVGFVNPDVYIFDYAALENRGEFIVRHPLPYSDIADMSADERESAFGPHAAVEYSHSMAEQIGGQLTAGFVLTDFQQAPHQSSPTGRYLPGYFATRAVETRKPARIVKPYRTRAGVAHPEASPAGVRSPGQALTVWSPGCLPFPLWPAVIS